MPSASSHGNEGVPGHTIVADPATSARGRHQLDESAMQRAVREAVRRSDVDEQEGTLSMKLRVLARSLLAATQPSGSLVHIRGCMQA